MNRLLCLVASLLLALMVCPAHAGLTIDIDSKSITAGSSGIVDVYVSSDAPDGSPDLLNQYGLQFLITTSGGSRLEFDPVNQPQAFLISLPYLFYPQSFDADSGTDVNSVAQTSVPNDTLNATDSTIVDTYELSLSSGPKLLARLQVTSLTALPPIGGDTFTISLVPGFGTGSYDDSDTTYFNVFDFGNGTQDSYVPFTSHSGTITIQSVPEPSTFGLTLLGMAIFTFGLVSRRRTASKTI